MRISPLLLTLAAGLAITGCGDRPAAAAPAPAPAKAVAPAITAAPGTPEFEAQRLKWFREARFGMFIHWGVYAVPAGTYQDKRVNGIGEWIMNNAPVPVAEYKAYAKDFTAAKYNPEQWAALAKRAGMKYVVITSKHHDGFTLFDSAASDWSSVKASGAKRDLIAPLEKAVRGQGLNFGLYYSQAQDWINAGGGAYKKKWDPAQEGPNARALLDQKIDVTTEDGKKKFDAAVQADYDLYLKNVSVPQVDELLTKFKPDLVWWDTPNKMTPERAALFAPVLAKHPTLVMNNRLGGGVKGDCETPEQHIPPRGFPGRDFEVCMTMNNTWGFKSYDDAWKPTRQILEHLSDISSKGGNFLLNVGPTAEGEIPQASIERLQAVGAWMDVNGEAIHATVGSPFAKRLPWGRVTRKDHADGTQTLYLHVWDWPKDGRLVLPHGGQPGTTARLLAGGAAVATAQDGERLVVTLPAAKPDPIISVIAVQLPKPVVDNDATLETPNAQGIVTLSVLEADSHGSYAGNMPVGGSGETMFLGPWTDSVWKLEYRFQAPKAQKWQLSAEIAGTEATKLKIGDEKTGTVVDVPATGGADVWKTVTLGTLSLKAGEASFRLIPEKKDWKAFSIRTVTLTPAP